ncbi:MAG: hypothetical protein AB4206_03230 [Xenococcaceae cyanobacterium]
MIECIPFDLSKLENIEDIPNIAKEIFTHFLDGSTIEGLAEEYKVNDDFIEEVVREVSNKIGANMIVEVLLDG